MFICIYQPLKIRIWLFSRKVNTKSGSGAGGSNAEDATTVQDISNPALKKWLPISSRKPIPKIESEENPIAENQEYSTLTEPDSNEDMIMREEAKRNIENTPPRISDIVLPVFLRPNFPKKLPTVFTRWVGAFRFNIISSI